MNERDESAKKTCKLFKMQRSDAPDFCEREFIPKVEWQKFCNNENKCHHEYWRLIYREKNALHKRLERLEEKAELSKQ